MKSYRKRLLQVIAGMELLQDTEWTGLLLFFVRPYFFNDKEIKIKICNMFCGVLVKKEAKEAKKSLFSDLFL